MRPIAGTRTASSAGPGVGAAPLRPWMVAATVIAAVAVAWFVLNAVRPVGPGWLLWAAIPPLGPIASWVFWRTSRTPGLPDAPRRLWGRLVAVPALISAAHTSQAVQLLGRPDTPVTYANVPLLVLDGAVVLLVVNAVMRLPRGSLVARPGTRTVLDAFTVLLAAAVVVWHFGARRDLESAHSAPAVVGAVVVAVGLSVLALLAVFALLRILLGDHSAIGAQGLRLLSAAAIIGALAPLAQPFVARLDPRLNINQLTVPVLLTLAASSAYRQRAAEHDRLARERRGRGFSLLPYAGVALVDVLLLWAAVHHDDVVVVALAAVVITGVVVVRQISALRDNGRLLERLDHGATHDALTGLANRVLVNRRLRQVLDGEGRAPVAVLLIDLDDFKEVNDTLGHEVGDQLLIEVARRIGRCVRRGDTVARLGGDEFVLVLADCPPRTADVVAGRVVESLRQVVAIDGHELVVRASIGIADGACGDDPGVLLRRADLAMYAAKLLVGSAFLHYRDEMATRRSDLTTLASRLRQGIEAGELTLHYQPIVRLSDGMIVGAEALVRWDHPVRGLLPPDVFIPVAERSGLSPALARWVLGEALAQLGVWSRRPHVALTRISVNLSAADLREASLPVEVRRLLDHYGLAAEQVTAEITESAALDGVEALDCLRELRALGVAVSLDDFGTGYSTLSVLRDCPVDEIKLDRTFTPQEDAGAALAAAVLGLARELGLDAVAEGVETPEQARRLAGLGYQIAQGYHFARPLTASALTAVLDAGGRLPLARGDSPTTGSGTGSTADRAGSVVQ